MRRSLLAGPGAALAIASATLFGAYTSFVKPLLGDGMSQWLLAGLLYLGSSGRTCSRTRSTFQDFVRKGSGMSMRWTIWLTGFSRRSLWRSTLSRHGSMPS